MWKMLTNEEVAKVYKYYMKQYFVKPDPELYKYFQEQFKTANDTMYCYGNRYLLRQCGLAFLDYQGNYKNHNQIISYDLLNSFLDKTNERYSEVFYDFGKYPLIIYHPTGTTENARLLSLITHVFSYRSIEKKKTLILSELNIKNQIIDRVTPITDVSRVEDICNDPYDEETYE